MSDFMDNEGDQVLVRLTQDGAVPVEDLEKDETEFEDWLKPILLELRAIRLAITELVNQGSEYQQDFLELAKEETNPVFEEN